MDTGVKMAKQYKLEFAVEAKTELKALNRLKELGVPNSLDAKLSDLDMQAGLIIITIKADKELLTDEMYRHVSKAKDVSILSDGLSAVRSYQIIKKSLEVENQIKKLLIYVLPEIENVIDSIIKKYQKRSSKGICVKTIDWCKKIHDFSFGELRKVLALDVSYLMRQQVSNESTLPLLIASASSFDDLKDKVQKMSEVKLVWDVVNSILEKPVEYSRISKALKNINEARNDAAHLSTITLKELERAQKDCRYVMRYIKEVKSNYRYGIIKDLNALASCAKGIVDSFRKNYYDQFVEFNKVLFEALKPTVDMISNIKIPSGENLQEVIQKNVDYQKQIANSLMESIKQSIGPEEWNETMKKLEDDDFRKNIADMQNEAKGIERELTNKINQQEFVNNLKNIRKDAKNE